MLLHAAPCGAIATLFTPSKLLTAVCGFSPDVVAQPIVKRLANPMINKKKKKIS